MSIAKTYQPNQVENKWYDHWLKKEYFSSNPDQREAFTIVIPPPMLLAFYIWDIC